MKITVNQKNFKKSLSVVEKIVSKNTTLPILNNILLRTENGRLRLSATNLELGINYSLGAKIDEVGEIAVPGRILADFVNSIVDEKISLSTKNEVLSMSSTNFKTQILGSNSKDFPIIPKIKGTNISVLDARNLKSSLLCVSEAMSLSEARPELSGVFLRISRDSITFAATDSFRLAEKIDATKNSQEASVILPRNTVTELIRVCGEIEGAINLNATENQICFSNDDFEFVSRVVDGSYPDYKKIIPTNFLSRVLTNKSELEKGVRIAGLFSSNISDVKLQCLDDSIILAAKNSDKGEVETKVGALLKNEPFEVVVNYHYLLDGLKILNDEKVIIEFNGAGSPLVLKSGDENDGVVYLIMPLRNQN
jgi:DNA polymerase-3 subunit beta